VTSLIPSGSAKDREIRELRERLGDFEAALEAQSAEIAGMRTDLAAFRIRYRQEVGLLHDQLDELEYAIAEAELGEISKRVAAEGAERNPPPANPKPETAPRFTSDAIRRLFRDVAKAIHPDLARDTDARDRRHALMIEANRAYAQGDEERLRTILQSWERSPEAVQGVDAGAIRLRLVRRIAEIEEELAACASELAELRDSPLGKLKAMVDEASTRGKDLVSDMVKRLKRDIMAAQNRLDAMRSHPR
jgi:hypothetical protein